MGDSCGNNYGGDADLILSAVFKYVQSSRGGNTQPISVFMFILFFFTLHISVETTSILLIPSIIFKSAFLLYYENITLTLTLSNILILDIRYFNRLPHVQREKKCWFEYVSAVCG